MPKENKVTGSTPDASLDQEEQTELMTYRVTEESRKRLYQTLYLIGAYVTVLVSLFTWFAYTNIDAAVGLLVGTPDHPTEFMQSILTEAVDKRTEVVEDNIIRRMDSSVGEYFKEVEEQVDRKIDNKMKEMDFRLGEIIRDNQEELIRIIEYRLNQMNR